MITADDVISIIGNGFTIGQLENGGQKEVFRASNSTGDFVLKFVKVEERDEDDQSEIIPLSADEERTRREVRLMESVQSNYLPTLGPIDLGDYVKEGLRYLIFSEQYIGDKSVKDLIAEGYFDAPDKVKAMVVDVTKALQEYNNFEDGFVHRDIKPGNIVCRNSEAEFVLIDGGIHLLPSNTTITSSRAFIGTHKYASPEQILRGRSQMDCRSDIFSLGVVLYEAASGKHPFYLRRQSPETGLDRHIQTQYSRLTGDMAVFNNLLSRMLTGYQHTRFVSPDDLLLDIEGVEI